MCECSMIVRGAIMRVTEVNRIAELMRGSRRCGGDGISVRGLVLSGLSDRHSF